ncbi:AAA family ATPase [Endozoicomonas numazuensis]|uniref:AAA family ATPase n=1 Tax=Endozoicomonas numazuensis TaxID=1137799 RepID=UPI000691B1C9|nr:AAA family ATPase [Endozoicomonas numazuensis]
MLVRIHRIKGIGLLHDVDARSHSLKKASFIYADNGRGKSTLASIFRSCSVNKPELIINRRTIDGNNAPEVDFQFNNGQRSTFQNGVWSQEHSELLVFDSDFVEQNVYAGGQVTSDQRKNLLQFALGESAVNAQRVYDQADEDTKAAAANVRDIISQLSAFHRGLTLSQFQALEEVTDIDSQINALNEKIVEAQNIDLIQAKASPKLLIKPNLKTDSIFEIFENSLDNIDLAAEEQVKAFIDSHSKPGYEKWISDGVAYGEQNCPFCDQSLEGLDLINAYRSYFNQDYNKLKSDVAKLEVAISTACSESIIETLKSSFTTASAVIDGWQEHIDIQPPVFDESKARQLLLEIKGLLTKLRQQKETQLLESIGEDTDKQQIDTYWQELLSVVDTCNETITKAREAIVGYKTNLASVNIENLRQQIQSLELCRTRYSPDSVRMLSELQDAQEEERNSKRDKAGLIQ